MNEEFKKTSYIIFTDCIIWYLLIDDGNSRIEEELSLVEQCPKEWIWKRKIHKFSDEDSEYEIEDELSDWKKLIEELTKFLEKSKINY